MLMLGTHNVSYVIGRVVVNCNMSVSNKNSSGLKVKSVEIPNATYTNRKVIKSKDSDLGCTTLTIFFCNTATNKPFQYGKSYCNMCQVISG